jgi:glucokinase
MEEALTRAGAHDARALAGLAEAGRYLGIGLANVVTLVTPDLVVVGGGNAAALDFMLPHVWEEMRRRVFMTSLDQVRIVRAELGVWAGAIGAAIHGAQAAAGD